VSEPVHICAVSKNEGRYLHEWCLFHQIVGVDHITIYDNGSTDDTLEVLRPFVNSGFVDLIDWPHAVPSQLAAYQYCLNHHRGEQIWIVFTDIDEFLFSPVFPTISEALSAIPHRSSAVGVNWMCFGNSGHQAYSPEPVIERFTWRLASTNPVNTHIKSLIWMGQDVHVGNDPHFFAVEHGTFTENGDIIDGPLSRSHSSNLLRLNHYVTKSDEELAGKIARGRADLAQPRQLSEFDGYHACEVDDREIQRFLPELKRRLECLV
jgi:hypothetical protein